MADYHNVTTQEEIHWKQKSRVYWIQHGDRNTKFFKLTNFKRRGFNKLVEIKCQDGTITRDKTEIKIEAVKFCQALLSKDQLDDIDAISQILQNIPCLIQQHINEELSRALQKEEVKIVLFLMNKAPGPYGFPESFFPKNWNIISDDIFAAALEFFRKDKRLKSYPKENLSQRLCRLQANQPLQCNLQNNYKDYG